jgi:hypothetical protein
MLKRHLTYFRFEHGHTEVVRGYNSDLIFASNVALKNSDYSFDFIFSGFHEKDKKPYCRKDFLAMFSPKCGGCNRPVLENYLSAMNTVWHPECFVCGVCMLNYLQF